MPGYRPFIIALLMLSASIASSSGSAGTGQAGAGSGSAPGNPTNPAKPGRDTVSSAVATFAGGPFWALEAAFEGQSGVLSVTTGYMGGTDTNPTYDEVIEGGAGHTLAVEVRFDPKKTRYSRLVDFYWRQIDPLAVNRQFADSGTAFRTVIYYRDEAQKRDAEMSMRRLQRGGRFKSPIATVMEPVGKFIPAEESQQDYYRKNPGRYEAWLNFSGREAALNRIWGTGTKVKALPHSGRASP